VVIAESSMDGHDSVTTSTGPMCRSLRDIDLFMTAVRGAKPHLQDPSLFPLPWAPEKLDRKIRIGVMRNDGVVIPHPPMQRAIEITVERLNKSDRFDVVDFEPYQQRHGLDIIVYGLGLTHSSVSYISKMVARRSDGA
jgi:amidase